TVPKLAASSATPTAFSNAGYVGDALGDSLDRTYEGYFEVLEMGVIPPDSDLARALIPSSNGPSCSGLPDVVEPQGLKPPTGGLSGIVSLINVNDGTDFTYDAVALVQWSSKVQWGMSADAHPNLADANPPVSVV